VTGGAWPVLVLSLPGCEGRRAPLLAALAAQGIAGELLLGVDGRSSLPAEHAAESDRDGPRHGLVRPMRDTEFACALWREPMHRLIAARRLEGGVVLEDDAIPLPGFSAVLKAESHRGRDLLMLDDDPARVMRGSSRPLLPGFATWDLALNAPRATASSISCAGGSAAAPARSADPPSGGLALRRDAHRGKHRRAAAERPSGRGGGGLGDRRRAQQAGARPRAAATSPLFLPAGGLLAALAAEVVELAARAGGAEVKRRGGASRGQAGDRPVPSRSGHGVSPACRIAPP
jgi:hypothetical protein